MIQSLRSLLQSTPAQLTAIAAATAFSVAPQGPEKSLSPNSTGPTCEIDVTRVEPFGTPSDLLLDREAWAVRETILDYVATFGDPAPPSNELVRFLELSYEEVDPSITTGPTYYWGVEDGQPKRICRQTKQIHLDGADWDSPISVDISWDVPL